MWRRKVTDRLLRDREVADLFGVSSGTILDWFEADKLPGFKLSSRAVRFRESEVLDSLEARRVPSDSSRRQRPQGVA